MVADINADNKDDIIGRVQSTGQWWAGISNGNTINNIYLGTWSTAVTWLDIMIADINADNKDDIIGRTDYGQWWAGISNGNTISNQKLGTWATITWNNVI